MGGREREREGSGEGGGSDEREREREREREVIIFNMVMNTMVDAIKSRPNLGYHLTERMTVLLLQYADDTCLVANSPSAAQELLCTVERCHGHTLHEEVGRPCPFGQSLHPVPTTEPGRPQSPTHLCAV